MKEFSEDEYLKLSGIQHFAFCKRQWALIHIEDQWVENYRTMDGNIMHINAHNASNTENRGDTLIRRGLRVFSSTLGVSGECDVVEFHRSESGIFLDGFDGQWDVIPIEYKRGKPKDDEIDEVQLCCEAMCLEEMLCCEIQEGYLYYGMTRKREKVIFTPTLRDHVKAYLNEMHSLFERQYTPKVKQHKECQSCSLKEICLPRLTKVISTSAYIKEAIDYEEIT